MSGDDEEEDDDDDEGFLSAAIAAARTREWARARFETHPTRNLIPGQTRICKDVSALLGQAFIYYGPGECVQHDRIYIKEVLKEKLSNVHAMLLKEVRVFVPCTLLEGGLELVDAPGTEDADPIKYRQLAEQIERADHIVTLLDKDLDSAAGTVEMLVRHGVFRRLVGGSLRLGVRPVRLGFILCSEKEERPVGADLLGDEWVERLVRGATLAATKVQHQLDQLICTAYRQAGGTGNPGRDR